MVGGRGFWILVWYGILALGLIGLWASVLWGRRLKWQNLDEFLRAIGTVQVSIGMLMLLYGVAVQVATGLLGLAFGVFVAAFVAGRNFASEHRRRDDDDRPEDTEPPVAAQETSAPRTLSR
jgi:hypothetical protein